MIALGVYLCLALFYITSLRTCEAVIPGIVAKCLSARPKTKQAAIDVCLMYTEIEQQAVVQVHVHVHAYTICTCSRYFSQGG